MDTTHFLEDTVKRIIPERMVLEFEVRHEYNPIVKETGNEFLKDGHSLTKGDIGLSDVELDLLYHGSERVNFRGALYHGRTESGINGLGQPIKRIVYDRVFNGIPPVF